MYELMRNGKKLYKVTIITKRNWAKNLRYCTQMKRGLRVNKFVNFLPIFNSHLRNPPNLLLAYWTFSIYRNEWNWRFKFKQNQTNLVELRRIKTKLQTYLNVLMPNSRVVVWNCIRKWTEAFKLWRNQAKLGETLTIFLLFFQNRGFFNYVCKKLKHTVRHDKQGECDCTLTIPIHS